MSILPLNEVQFGKETTFGTIVAPTVKLMGVEEFELQPIVEAHLFEDLRGSLQPGHDAQLVKQAGEASLSMSATYDDIAYLLDSLDIATPSGVGPYTRTYAAPAATLPTPRINTITYGQTDEVEALTSGYLKTLTISGESNAPIMVSADFIGHNVVGDTLAALSDRAVTHIMGQHGVIYIDPAGGTLGATAISNVWFSFEMVIETNRSLIHHLGALSPTRMDEARWSGELTLNLEIDATTDNYLVDILAASAIVEKQVRLKFSDTANRDLELDFAGVAMEAPPIFSEVDGVLAMELVLGAMYSDDMSNWFKATSINQVATLA